MALSNKSFIILGIIMAVVVILLFILLGRACSCSGQANKEEAITVKIIKVVDSPTDEESITIKNTGSVDVDLKDWSLGDKNDPDARGLDDILKAGKTRKYDRESLGFGINDKDEIIYLKKDGKIIDKWEN